MIKSILLPIAAIVLAVEGRQRLIISMITESHTV